MATPIYPQGGFAAQFTPYADLRCNAAAFAQILADYSVVDSGAGYVFLYGVSPVALAAQYGATVFNDPAPADYGTIPRMFTTTAGSMVQGSGISTSANGINSLALGTPYVDLNGQSFSTVTWGWGIQVTKFTDASRDIFSQQMVTWNGDGIADRLISTTIDLTVGVTVVWIFSDLAAPVFCTSAMVAASKFATYSVTPASTTLGVKTLQATGFTVTDGTDVKVNAVGAKYVAIVWNDTRGTKMSVGTYTGTWTGTPPNNVGATINVTAGVENKVPVSFLMTTAGIQPSPGGNPDGVFAMAEFGLIARNIASNEAFPLTGHITAMTTGSFTVGPTVDAYGTGRVFYYVAFALTADDPVRLASFKTWTIVGTAGADIVTGLDFTPTFALARTSGFPTFAAAWRGPADTGTASHDTTIGAALATTGIEGFGVGTLTLGSAVSPVGVTVHGFALAGAPAAQPSFPPKTFVKPSVLDNGDGIKTTIEIVRTAQLSPGTGWTAAAVTPTVQWWCNAKYGQSVYQVDSPGAGWVACSGPATLNGWYLSNAAFGGQPVVVSGGRPADPRPWVALSSWATGNRAVLGGAPAASCSINNHMVYPASGYVVGTDYPPIRIFDGRSDKELCRLPPTTANVIPKAVMSVLTANGIVYLSTWDSGTSQVDWAGRVFQLNPVTGILTVLGTVFTAGEMPYALAWHMGRLWCGTSNGIGTVGKVYFFRPGIDTAWTQDYSLVTSAAGGVTSMASYKGKLYVGTDNAAGSRGKVLERDTAGAYTTSQTGTGGAAVLNNGYLALTVLGANLYASYWNNDTTVISKIEKFTGSVWSTAYTGAGATLRPYILLQLDNGQIYAVGGSVPYTGVILATSDGTTWTDLTSQLPVETVTLLPMLGAVVT